MILDEKRQMVKSISITLILHKYFLITRLPLLLLLDIPILFHMSIIQKSHNSSIVLTTSINILQIVFFCHIRCFVTFVIDVVHRCISLIEITIHLHPLIKTWLTIVIQSTNSSELIPCFCCKKSSVIQELVMVIRLFLYSWSMTFVRTDTWIAQKNTLEIEVVIENYVRIVVLFNYCLRCFYMINCCVSMTRQVKLVFSVWRKSGHEDSQWSHYFLNHIFVFYYIVLWTCWVANTSWQLQVQQISTIVPGILVYLKCLLARRKGERSILVECSQKTWTTRSASQP